MCGKNKKKFCFKEAKSTCSSALIKLLLFRCTEVHKCKFLQLSNWAVVNMVKLPTRTETTNACKPFYGRPYFCFPLLFHQVSLCQLERFVLQGPLHCKDRQRDCLVHLAWVVVFSEIRCHEGQTRRL